MSPKIDNRPAADELRDAIFQEHVGETAEQLATQAKRSIAESMLQAAQVAHQQERQYKGWTGLPAEKQVYSLGEICRGYRVAPQLVRAICSQLEIEPVLLIDDRPFFLITDYILIGRAIRKVEQEAEAQQQAAQ